jgi:hypothetical protein
MGSLFTSEAWPLDPLPQFPRESFWPGIPPRRQAHSSPSLGRQSLDVCDLEFFRRGLPPLS